MSWFAIKRNLDGTAQVSVRGEIGLWDNGDVDLFLGQLGQARVAELLIDSPGGCSIAARKIYSALKDRVEVVTVLQRCCSSAFWFVLAGRKIRCQPDSLFLVHRSRVAILGDREQLLEAAAIAESSDLAMIDALSKRVDPDVVKGWLSSSIDTWLTAAEALEIGLVDQIIPDRIAGGIDASGDSAVIAADIDAADETEVLLLDMLRLIGQVRSTNLRRLKRELSLWWAFGVSEISPPSSGRVQDGGSIEQPHRPLCANEVPRSQG